MDLLPDERTLLESDPKGLVLTTHRVRSDVRQTGNAQVTSIMLEQIASCAITGKSYPILLAIAAISGVIGMVGNNSTLMIAGLAFAALLVVAYFSTRQQVIALASAGHTITRSTQGMDVTAALQFIDKLEAAKDSRIRQMQSYVR